MQKLLHDQEESVAKSVPEEDLRKYYEAHLAEFVRPERIRVSIIFIAAPAGSPKRGQANKEAVALAADLKAKEAGPVKTAFAEAARSRSEDAASKPLGGDLNLKTHEELAQAWGPAVADAASAMKTVGEISSPVATDKGFYILKLTARQPGINIPFEAARAQMEARLKSELRTKNVESFVSGLRAKTKITVHDEALAAVDVHPVPTGPPSGLPRPPIPSKPP